MNRCLTSAVLGVVIIANAGVALADLREDLAAASQHVSAGQLKLRTRMQAPRVNAATVTPAPRVVYHVGEQWQVLAALLPATMAYMPTPLPSAGVRNSNDFSQFHATIVHFTVSQVLADRTRIEITRDDTRDVSSVTIDEKQRVLQSSGILGTSGADLFPFSVPSFDEKSGQAVDRLPPLPNGLPEFAGSYTLPGPGLTDALQYDSTDSFGRPVQLIWRKGDPWPVYMKTSAGMSVLLK